MELRTLGAGLAMRRNGQGRGGESPDLTPPAAPSGKLLVGASFALGLLPAQADLAGSAVGSPTRESSE